MNEIYEIIQQNAIRKSRLKNLESYYLGKNTAINAKQAPEFSPNNKMATPFAEYIADFCSAYLVGNPVVYGSSDEDFVAQLNEINKFNDIATLDLELATDQAIFGEAYCLVWVDKTGTVRYNAINPIEVIPVYDGTVENNLEMVIRHYTANGKEFVILYDHENIITYTYNHGVLEYKGQEPHYFGDVPFIEFLNNRYKTGDFEKIMDLIDAYDKLLSLGLDDLEKSADAYLCLRGMAGTSAEDLASMREARALLLGENDDAFFLEKTGSSTQQSDTLTRIDNDIHRFSCVPNLTDENLGSASGVAIKYRNQSLDNKTQTKEGFFRKGLARRVELTTNILNRLGASFDFTDITFTFTRSLPVDESAMIDNIVKLTGLVPDEILLAQLPFIDDVQEALDIKYNAVDVEE